jgi:hypothetical protein
MVEVVENAKLSRPRVQRAAHHQREWRAALLRLGGLAGRLHAALRQAHYDCYMRDGPTRCACTQLYAHVESLSLPAAARTRAAHGGSCRRR